MSNAEDVRNLIGEAQRLLARAAHLLDGEGAATRSSATALASVAAPEQQVWRSADTPLRLEDLNGQAIADTVAELSEVFDTYHVVEHPMFRQAHEQILDRPAINQLTGKFLRRHQAELGVRYLDQRGRRRSALWRKG